MTNFKKHSETKRKSTYRFRTEEGLNKGTISFYIDTVITTYQDGSVSTKDFFIKSDGREYTTIGRSYVEYKNLNTFNSAMKRLSKDGFISI